jgi:flagellar hook-length control protein FliK
MAEPLSLQTIAPAAATPQTVGSSAHSDPSDPGSATADANQFDALLQSKRAAMAAPAAKTPASDSGSSGGPVSTRPKTTDDAEADARAGQNPLDQIAYSAGDSSVPVIALPIIVATAPQALVTAPKTPVAVPKTIATQPAMITPPDIASERAATTAQPKVGTLPAAMQPRTVATGAGDSATAATLTPVIAPALGGAAAKPTKSTSTADDFDTAKASAAADRIPATEAPTGQVLPAPKTGMPESAQIAQAAQSAPVAPTGQTTGERPAISERRRVTADAVADADAAARQDSVSSYALPNAEAHAAEKPRDTSTPVEATNRIDATSMTNATPVPNSAERATSITSAHVEPHVGERGWNQAFASQVTVLVSNREPQAQIQVNPQHLGPVDVQIGMDGDKVSLAFTALHPDTRAAIQDALPQLREMLADSGLSLGNASVSTESSQRDPSRPEFAGTARSADDEAEAVAPAIMNRMATNRLVDTFA